MRNGFSPIIFGAGGLAQLIGSGLSLGTKSVVRTGQTMSVQAAGLAKIGGTAGFLNLPVDNLSLVTCPQAQTGAKLILPVPNFKPGCTLNGFNLVGNLLSGGNAVTIDADLRSQTVAAGSITDASVGAITQVSVTTNTALSVSNSNKTFASPLVTLVGVNYYIVVTVTTGVSCSVNFLGAVINFDEA